MCLPTSVQRMKAEETKDFMIEAKRAQHGIGKMLLTIFLNFTNTPIKQF